MLDMEIYTRTNKKESEVNNPVNKSLNFHHISRHLHSFGQASSLEEGDALSPNSRSGVRKISHRPETETMLDMKEV